MLIPKKGYLLELSVQMVYIQLMHVLPTKSKINNNWNLTKDKIDILP